MDITLGLDKAVAVVETPPYRVFLKDLNMQWTVESNRMVCECFPESPPVKGRFKKQPTDLISDDCNEPEWFFILFQNPRFRIWKVDVAHVLSYLRHEVVRKKRMCQSIRVVPDLDEGICIFGSIFSYHCHKFTKEWFRPGC